MPVKKVDGSELNGKRSRRFGYVGLFAHRDSIQEAHDGALSMIEGAIPKDVQAHALTAMMIVQNTYALILGEQREVINELRELARATRAYCVQDSRSSRRRAVMIKETEDALINAQDVFGDEDENSTT